VSSLRIQRVSVVRLLRYVLNGLIATGVHYAVLSLLVGPMGLRLVGLANLAAAVSGTVASFLGNRRYVFKATAGSLRYQVQNFVLLYGVLAVIHSACMYVWSDHLGRDYQTGFIAATALQFLLSYIANSHLVFKNSQTNPDGP